jgi:hypothetical protein
MNRISLTFFTLIIFAACVLASPAHLWAVIDNTLHNLSVTGTGTVHATSETEICVFCHIPHNATPAIPLWNHDMPTTSYTMYESEYLSRAAYPLPTELGTALNQPGLVSRLCLSCHDGTVAIGALYMLRGTVLGDSLIAMTSVGSNYEMQSTSAAFIGTDLTKHHPVAIKYDPNVSIAFDSAGSGSNPRTIELVSPPAPPIKLYTIGDYDYVECASCHDPHIENDKFLRVKTGANYAEKVSTTCDSCHLKTDWAGSIHQTDSSSYTDTDVQSTFGVNNASSLLCMNCHRSHKGEGAPYLLRRSEETTCFQGAASSVSGAPCHGTGGSAGGKDIESILTQSYSHPVTSISGVHTALDVLDPLGGTPVGSKGLDWANSKHSECVDCHNPHKAEAGTHNVPTDISGWYPQTPIQSTNNASNALKGVTGIEPDTASAWTVPVSFITIESAEKEYQICFKCHSYYSLRDAGGITSYFTQSGATVTDQAMEFNPNNASAHPVAVRLLDQTGSPSPKALDSSQLEAPWSVNAGNQTMYCSDCHGSDNVSDPAGPHGSNSKHMLKGDAKYWPLQSDDATPWVLSDLGSVSANNALFCTNCHPNDRSLNNVHNDTSYTSPGSHSSIQCIQCHIAVPHGGENPRLIGYISDPEPYNYSGTSLLIINYTKASGPNNYVISDCLTGCHP